MPSPVAAVLLGLVEGLTEFIPVSSTGHLLIAERWLGRRPDWFTVVIQVGAAMALLPLFWARLRTLATPQDPSVRDYLVKLIGAFLLTVVGGLMLDRAGFTLPEEAAPVAWASLIGGIAILAIERWRNAGHETSEIGWTVALAVGAAQLLAAVFPGTSRSGATIMVAIALGMSRAKAAEFSFLLGMGTLTAAGVFVFLRAWSSGQVHGESVLDLALAVSAAALSAFVVVRWLLRFVQDHTFNGFAAYRILLGLVVLLWV